MPVKSPSVGTKARAAGKLVRQRRSQPLPPFSSPLLDGSLIGALSADHLRIIRQDERWYGDGKPQWKNAPAAEAAVDKRQRAVTRLGEPEFVDIQGVSVLTGILGSCAPESRCGSHACFECARACQRWLIAGFANVLRRPLPGYQDYTFNFVMPEGQAAIPDLRTVPFDAILEKCRSALSNSSAVAFGVMGFDISANDDTTKYACGKLTDGLSIYWQVHVYGIVRTSDRRVVWAALRPLFAKAANIYRPLRISRKPFDGAAKGISYVAKPQGFRHVSYVGWNGQWNTPRKPPALKAREHVHYMLAMHCLGFARRISLVGLHPSITPANNASNRAIYLRRVHRGGGAM